jgi:AcrR family transcriptional regulator
LIGEEYNMVSKNSLTLGLRERKKAKTMINVQKKALDLFNKQGYKSTTVEQIAEAADISPSTFFRYFATKEEVVILDLYDELLIRSLEEQPEHLSPLQALKNAMLGGMDQLTEEEIREISERNQLIMSIPELRAASINSMANMMTLLVKLIEKRSNNSKNKLDAHILAGGIIGVNISVMTYCADHPDEDFVKLITEGLSQLENGLN